MRVEGLGTEKDIKKAVKAIKDGEEVKVSQYNLICYVDLEETLEKENINYKMKISDEDRIYKEED